MSDFADLIPDETAPSPSPSAGAPSPALSAPTPAQPGATAPAAGSFSDLIPDDHPAAKAAPTVDAKPITRMERFEHGLWQPIEGATQALTHALPESVINAGNKLGSAIGLAPMTADDVDKQAQEQEAHYQAGRQAAGQKGIDWIETAGNALPIIAGGPAAGGMRAAIATGALSGATQPVTEKDKSFWGEKAAQTGIGAATGPFSVWTSRLLQPVLRPALDYLVQRGVNPTIGQIAGGVPKWVEERLSGLPFVGDLIKSAHRGAIQDFNRAGYNEALTPIGERSEGAVGHAGVADVEQKLGDAFDKLLPQMRFRADPAFTNNLQNLRNLAGIMPKPQAERFEQIMQNTFDTRLNPQTGAMDGKTLKGLESELRTQAAGYLRDPSFDNRQLGSAIQEAQALLRASLERQNPVQAGRLADINQGWAVYARLRNAASKLGTEEGQFSPAQMANASRRGDASVEKGATARGTALMQQFSEAGKSVLGNKIPDSGTAGRLAMYHAIAPYLGMGAVAGGSYELDKVNPAAAAGLGGLGLAYTPAGRRIMANILTRRPGLVGAATRPAARAFRELGPTVGADALEHYMQGSDPNASQPP